MDLNLYLGLPRYSRPLSLDLGSDLSLSSLSLPSSSNSGDSRAPEATSGAMEASASYALYYPYHDFIGLDDAPSVSPWPSDLDNPIRTYFHAYETYVLSCAQEDEGPSASNPPSNAQGLQIEQMAVGHAERDVQRHSSFDEILGRHLVADDSVHAEDFQMRCSRTYPPPSADFHDEPLLRSQDFRIRRLMESHGWRQNFLYCAERTNFAPSSSPSSEQLMPGTMSSQPNGKQKAPAESIDAERSENGADEKNKCSSNFDCNICFDMSKEPVVTSCGHLFCWPCLYQWLHIHSQHKDCPVCKLEVIEATITPIYGRGSSESEMETKDEESKALGLSIPPRPRGHRTESWRQHFYQNSQRIGAGIANPRRRFLNYQLSSRGVVPVPDETDGRIEIRSLIAMNFGTSAGGNILENPNGRELSPSVNAPTPDQFVHGGRQSVIDQASASSTVAMISGESSVRDSSTEPNSAGSSRPPRMIRGISAASDDGGNLGSCKRRRLH